MKPTNNIDASFASPLRFTAQSIADAVPLTEMKRAEKSSELLGEQLVTWIKFVAFIIPLREAGIEDIFVK